MSRANEEHIELPPNDGPTHDTTSGNTTKQSATLLTNKFLRADSARRWAYSVGGTDESSTKRADRG